MTTGVGLAQVLLDGGQLVGRVKDRTRRHERYIRSIQIDAD